MRICSFISYVIAFILVGLWRMDREGAIELGSLSKIFLIGWFVMLALGFVFLLLYFNKKEKDNRLK